MSTDEQAPSTSESTSDQNSPTPAQTSRGGFGRLIRSKWFVIGAFAVALLLIVTAVVVYIARFDPFGPSTASPDRAPTGFPTSLAITSTPVVDRGATVQLQLQVSAPTAVERIELWDGGNLYYSDAKPPQVTIKNGIRLVTMALEYVPVLPGLHWLSARAYTAKKGSVSDPISLPVRDLAPTGAATGGAAGGAGTPGTPAPSVLPLIPVQVHSAPGDTAGTVADRLGVPAANLVIPALGGVPIAAGTVLPARTLVVTSLIATAIAQKLFGPKKKPVSHDPALIVSVEKCQTIIVITNANDFAGWALYATTPLHSGYQRIGDIEDGARFTTASAPIGETSYMAFRIGTTDADVNPATPPTAPVVGFVPDECADSGWTGTAKIVNGMLLTTSNITNPYAYVSVDQGDWQRIPAQQGSFLPSGSANDVRSDIPQTKYDQLDIKMYGFDNGTATEAGTGTFCRATMTTPDPKDSSGSGGKCQPKGAVAKDGPESYPATKMVLTAKTSAKPNITLEPDPRISASYSLDSDVPVTFEAAMNGTNASQLELQFSYFPIGVDSVSTHPPGVFLQEWMKITSSGGDNREAKLTVHPWIWKNSKVDIADPFASLPDGQALSIDDQISIEIANARIAAGKDLLDTMYVRAVALTGWDNQTTGLASPTIKIDMNGPRSYPVLATPTVVGLPGIDFHTEGSAVLSSACFGIARYPDDDPNAATAHLLFPDPKATYCLADDYQYQRQQDAESDDGCSLGCFLAAVIIGAAVGVVTGGVGGALVGGAIAAGLAAIGGPLVAGLEKQLAALWDEIASAYNKAYQLVLTLAADLNPVCIGVNAFAGSSSGAADACAAVTKAVASSAITSLTGLPPALPMTETLEEVASGKVGAIATAAMGVALGQLGLSCDDFTVPASGSNALGYLAQNQGGAASKAVKAATDPDTGAISGCAAVSGLVSGAVQTSLEADYSTIYSGLYGGEYLPPGLLVNPIASSTPRIIIVVPASDPDGSSDTCPVTMNLSAHIPRQLTPKGRIDHYDEYDFWPIQTELTRPDKHSGWSATIPIPLYDGDPQPDLTLVENPDGTPRQPGDGSSELLQATVDSPCFAVTYKVNFSTTGSDWPAFVEDSPTIIPIH